MIFLTDGRHWIGPYVVGDIAINRGKLELTENYGATEVYAVTADTEEQARRTFKTTRKDR